jgi:hypothetical protein
MTHPISTDWRQTKAAFTAVFGDVPYRRTTLGLRDPNFLTQEVLGCWNFGAFRGEVSTGLFPCLGERPRRDQRLFGFTFRADSLLRSQFSKAALEFYDISELCDSDFTTMEQVRERFDELVAEGQRIVAARRARIPN